MTDSIQEEIIKRKIEIHPEKCTGCLLCQLACSFTHTDIFNPFSANIRVEWSPGDSKIYFTDECIECGICADYCFYGCLKKVNLGGER
ncbi:MAG: 4Fe-4S binding protein [Promethearchaeota archaeon]